MPIRRMPIRQMEIRWMLNRPMQSRWILNLQMKNRRMLIRLMPICRMSNRRMPIWWIPDSLNADSPNADSPKTDSNHVIRWKLIRVMPIFWKLFRQMPILRFPNVNMPYKEQKMIIIPYVLLNNEWTMVFCFYSLLLLLFIISSNRIYSLFFQLPRDLIINYTS